MMHHKYQIKDQEVIRNFKNREDGSQHGMKKLNHKYSYGKNEAIHLLYKINYSRKAQIITWIDNIFI
jgi:hypothetical protein